MALARQTHLALILIFISAHIIAEGRVDAARSAAAGPAQPKSKKNEMGLGPSRFLGDIPKDTAGGQDVANMVAKQMQAIEKKVGEFSATLKKRMDHPEASPGTQECFSECDEVFGAAVDDIKKALDSINSQNLAKANFDVSAVATNVDTCNDCFNEMAGGDPEVKQLNDWVERITGEALDALQKATA